MEKASFLHKFKRPRPEVKRASLSITERRNTPSFPGTESGAALSGPQFEALYQQVPHTQRDQEVIAEQGNAWHSTNESE